MMNFVFKNDEFYIKNDEFWIKSRWGEAAECFEEANKVAILYLKR